MGLLNLLVGPPEHEWWAVTGGLVLKGALAWASLLGFVVFGPIFLGRWYPASLLKIDLIPHGTVAWLAATLASLFSPKTAENPDNL